MDDAFAKAYDAIPLGYSTGYYQGRRYGIRKSATEDKRRGNLVAEELGGADYISLNFYRLSSGIQKLKPCEMPAQKVIDFVLGVTWMAAKSPL
jgi:hypothetical protein